MRPLSTFSQKRRKERRVVVEAVVVRGPQHRPYALELTSIGRRLIFLFFFEIAVGVLPFIKKKGNYKLAIQDDTTR
jgi:hypothetical protein